MTAEGITYRAVHIGGGAWAVYDGRGRGYSSPPLTRTDAEQIARELNERQLELFSQYQQLELFDQ